MPTDSSWYQMALTPPDVIELVIRVGVIPSTDHAQVLVELKDPVTNILIGQWSAPHAQMASYAHLLDMARVKGLAMLDETLEPF